ncbi:NEL-type E3 ubiquitin ligase domain-containing protein [Pseudomonas maumuensis]|uniref:NEL domain-containing protein n=1 Tax=Pseudomonas maumuensis TaxID=2842354 RepID=A0ABX8NFP9_9PSED|nr:NEL-type E3 ubiquitin ligase domain-containing protein [Pseudomonas maumuensis]QXH54824.1 hypothetical protein KSS90_15810 [Pseudomonas maumuensis]
MGIAQSHEALEQAGQDHIIGARLPAWITSVSASDAGCLSVALNASLDCRQRLAARLAAIQGPDAHARSLLQNQLSALHGVGVDVDRLWYRHASSRPLSTYAPLRVPLSERVYYQVPLLEAALRNFTAEQSVPGGQAPGTGLRDASGDEVITPDSTAFAKLVRQLDLGRCYQEYLDRQFAVADMKALLADSYRHSMLLDAFKARHAGVLSGAELNVVIGLWRDGWVPRLDDEAVIAKRLVVLGYSMQQILVLDERDETFAPIFTSTRRVLVYIPGDPHGAWSGHASLLRFVRERLGQRLRDEAYLRFFARFVRRRDSQAFFSQVMEGYHDLPAWANIDLDEKMLTLPTPLFDALAQWRMYQFKDDATLLATPTALLDRQVQEAHERRLAVEGWSLLVLAGLFVPAIGLTLLAVTAWELLGEVFQAFEAWREGDMRQALEHVGHVAIDLATMAVTAAAITAVRRAWTRSPLVDRLLQANLEDGSQRLWDGDLAAFRGAPPAGVLADDQGIWRQGGQAWIEMDGHHYPVMRRVVDDHWQLVPRQGHGPLLLNNGAGAWRLWYEQPARWRDAGYLFRRLGGPMAALTDAQAEQVMRIHDLDSAHLRALHVRNCPPGAGMVDTTVRVVLDLRVRALVQRLRGGERIDDALALTQARGLEGARGLSGEALAERVWSRRRQLLEQLYEAQSPTDSPDVVALRRVFPTLHRRAAAALLERASAVERERLLQSGRVPLSLAEAARDMSMQVRVARVLEALHLDMPEDRDLARVVTGLLRQLPGSAAGVRWRILEGSDQPAPALACASGEHAYTLEHDHGCFRLLNADGEQIGDSGSLFEVLANAYDENQRASLQLGEPFAGNLRARIGQLALERRADVRRLLGDPGRTGWFRLPDRLPDGRIGYPLSGRGQSSPGPEPYRRRLRYLFPTFTDGQVDAWIAAARRTGSGLERRLRSAEQEFAALNRRLRDWVQEGASAQERSNRRRVRRALRSCWQHILAEGEHGEDLSAVYHWDLVGARTNTFPELPAQVRFSHVNSLSLSGMQLENLPESFLQAFPNLRFIDLPGNRLTRVPQALLQMRRLQSLNLEGNQIVLDAAQSTILASCSALVRLNLSRNPLGRVFSVSGLPHLRALYLAGTGIDCLPYMVMENASIRTLDLRDNRFTSLPEHFYASRLWTEGEVQLRGNPLTTAETNRLHQALLASLPSGVARSRTAVRLRWMDTIGLEARAQLSACWETLQAKPGCEAFFDLLEGLLQTHDCQFHDSARNLALRVLALMKAMGESDALRQEIFANSSQLTCQDSVALRFSDLEVRLLLARAQETAQQGDQERALLRLGRRLWRLEAVDDIALADIQARRADGGNPDQIEVALAYRVALRGDLDLPMETHGMLFREVSGVDRQRIERARAQVLEAETGERLAASLVDREFWRTHLRNAHAQRFTALDAPFHERLERVFTDTLAQDQASLEATQLIQAERDAAERLLMLELTREALEVQAGSDEAPLP